MSAVTHEPGLADRVKERPALHPDRLRDLRVRDLGIRFLAGAVTSVVCGVVTLVFGARVGGILLAFPAILAASLTLIEREEDSSNAREDARGAIVGAVALIVFAVVAALTFGAIAGGLALVAATGAWLGVALGGYGLAWWR